MAFRAKFPGTCATCRQPIRSGELIEGKTRAYSHSACVAQAVDAGVVDESQIVAQATEAEASNPEWEAFRATYAGFGFAESDEEIPF